MAVLLFILAVLSGLFAFAMFGGAASAMHETTAAIFALMAAVLLVGATIIEAISKVQDAVDDMAEDMNKRLDKITTTPARSQTEPPVLTQRSRS